MVVCVCARVCVCVRAYLIISLFPMFCADSISLMAIPVQSKLMHVAALGMVLVYMFTFVFICTYMVSMYMHVLVFQALLRRFVQYMSTFLAYVY